MFPLLPDQKKLYYAVTLQHSNVLFIFRMVLKIYFTLPTTQKELVSNYGGGIEEKKGEKGMSFPFFY